MDVYGVVSWVSAEGAAKAPLTDVLFIRQSR